MKAFIQNKGGCKAHAAGLAIAACLIGMLSIKARTLPVWAAAPDLWLNFANTSIGNLHEAILYKGMVVASQPNLYARAKGRVKLQSGQSLKLSLNFDGTKPELLECLKDMPSGAIVSIDCGNLENFGDLALARVSRCKGLLELYLLNTSVSDKGLPSLASMSDLKKIQLAETDVSAAGLEDITKLKSLTNLNLRMTNLKNSDLHPLCKMKTLKILNLSDANIDKQAIDTISQMTNLEELCLSGNGKLTDKDIAKLKTLKNLINLDLKNTSITPLSIATFKSFPKLQVLSVSFNKTAESKLRSQMPKIKLSVENERSQFAPELFGPLH